MGQILVHEAMLMTAGLGTRLRPFTDALPKALMPIMGVPVVQFAWDALLQSGVTRVVANLHHLSDVTKAGLSQLVPAGRVLRTSDESDALLGSAGGIRHALGQFDSKAFFYVNADVLSDVSWKALAECHYQLRAESGVKVTLAVLPQGGPGEKYREIIFDPKTRLIKSLGKLKEKSPFFASAAVIEREAVERLKPGNADFVASILEPAIREGKAGVFPYEGIWYDLGSPRLWYQMHLEMLRRLEDDDFASPSSRLWRHRIEHVNECLDEKIWVAKGSPKLSLTGPCYWDGRGVSAGQFQVGSNGFLYGAPVEGARLLQNGIGINKLWYSAT